MTSTLPALGADWQQTLSAHSRAVVFFWASWSPPDRMFLPVLQRVAPEFAVPLAFYTADLDEEELVPLFAQAGVMTSPQLVLFHNGQPRERTIGYLEEAALRQKLRDWLALD